MNTLRFATKIISLVFMVMAHVSWYIGHDREALEQALIAIWVVVFGLTSPFDTPEK